MARRINYALTLVLIFAVSGLPTPVGAFLPTTVEGKPLPTLAPMLEQVMPAVVNIATRGKVRIQGNPLFDDPFFRHFFDLPQVPEEQRTQSLGSGVVVEAEQGYILTNHHVIDKAQEITVTLRDGRRLNARLIGTDPEADVAVIQVPAQKLVALPMANSDHLRVGDFVLAVGNPFGLGQTVTSGIVSALGRSGLGIEGYEDFIQTDASINPGNSGGALVNLRGELVGINTAILAPSGGNIGIGFAIPTNMAREIMLQLIEYGEVRRGRLGVQVQDLTPDLARAFGLQSSGGAVVGRVVSGSAAEAGGLRGGDVITAVNGRPVRNADDLRNRIGLLRIGQTVRLEILRNGEPSTLEVTIDDPKQAMLSGERLDPRLAGAMFGDIEEDSPQYGRVAGVVVLEVELRSPASHAGLREGDIMISLNRRPLRNTEDLKRAVALNDSPLLMNIRRKDTALFLVIR
jgi:periplasmic serine protease, Do/DeqQ family